MRSPAMKVGELAKKTGVSVRTLHYYDEIGLLEPSCHTEAGYRLYTTSDIVRLQQIKSLQQLGFSLEEIRECLERPDFSKLLAPCSSKKYQSASRQESIARCSSTSLKRSQR